jgi:hypothetical protein
MFIFFGGGGMHLSAVKRAPDKDHDRGPWYFSSGPGNVFSLAPVTCRRWGGGGGEAGISPKISVIHQIGNELSCGLSIGGRRVM